MIALHTWKTPNGRKVSIMLEECGLEYVTHPVDLGRGDQQRPGFLALNPNGKIPVIVDHDGPDGQAITLFESGAILIYLADKTGRYLARAGSERYRTLQWLMLQMGGIGPILGQLHHYYRIAPEPVAYTIARFDAEARRVYRLLDGHFADHQFLAGELSIADFATLPWIARHEWHKIDLADHSNVKRWYDMLMARPAVARGMNVPGE